MQILTSSTEKADGTPFSLPFVLFVAFALTLTYHLVARMFAPGLLLGLDDGYIHASIARTFASTGQFAIQPGASPGGSSSLLWTFLISLLSLFGLPADIATFILGTAAFLFLLLTVHRFAVEIMSRRQAFYATLLLGLSGMQAALSLTGMESQLATAFLFGGFGAGMRNQNRFSTVCFSLAVLTRPEMLLAPIALGIIQIFTRRDNPSKPLPLAWFQLGTIAGVALLGILVLSLLSGGLPSTFGARRWLYGLGEGLFATQGPALKIYSRFIVDMANRLAGMIGPGELAGWFWALVVLELLASGAMVLWRRNAIPRALVLFLGIHLLFVMFGLGSSGHYGRYLEPIWVSLPLLVVLGWTRAMQRLQEPLQRGIAILVTLLLIAGFLPQAHRWAQWHTSSLRHLFDVHHMMAETVRRQVPPGEQVAAFDIGLMAWECGHPLIDIGGLNDRDMVHRMYSGTVPEYLASHHVHWLVLPHPGDPRLRAFMARRLNFPRGTLRTVNSWYSGYGTEYLAATRVAMPALSLLKYEPIDR